MKVLLVLSVIALIGAAAARADGAPAGFTAAPKFGAAASYVAGKPVAIYCAPTQAALSAVAVGNATDALGVTPNVGEGVVYLSPQVCGFLNAWVAGRKPANLYGLAGSLETLAHEAEHARGITDETDTDCAALAVMPAMVNRYFPLRKRLTMHQLMGLAASFHDSKSIAYTAHPC